MAPPTKGALVSLIEDVGKDKPCLMVMARIDSAEFMKQRWNGESMVDLTSAEYFTRVNLVWLGGNMNVNLPPVFKDVTSRLVEGTDVLAVIPQNQKGGQLRNDFENAAIIGAGFSKFEELVMKESGGLIGAAAA